MIKTLGFSLVELLIAMTISMIALIAITDIYITTRQTARIQSIQKQIAEDGRFAMSVIQRSINQAGYRNDTKTAIQSDRIAGNATQVTLKFDSDGSNHMNCNISSASNGSHTMVISKNANALQCSFDGAAAVDWLNGATSGTGTSSIVSDFNIQYGVDTGPSTVSDFGCGVDAGGGNLTGDCVADTYSDVIPKDVNADGDTLDSVDYVSSQVMTVNVCLLLRSELSNNAIIKSSNVKNCSGVDIANSKDDHYLYRRFNTTVFMKSR